MNRLSSSLALAAIGFYRRYLSPLKGYRCAYGVAHGTSTCSGQGLRIFRRAGVIKGMKLLRRQFDACTLAAEQLRNSRTHLCRIGEDRETQEAQGPYLRYRRLNAGYARSQAGVVDCDCGGAAPDCGSPDCGGGKDCMPDCTPDCPDCNPRTSLCRAGSNWLDFLDCCCDGSTICDTSDKKSFERRVAAARERQAQAQESRQERRRKRKDESENADDSPSFGSDDDSRGTVRHGHDGHDAGDGGNDSDSSGSSDD